jgi:hypothetical protein
MIYTHLYNGISRLSFALRNSRVYSLMTMFLFHRYKDSLHTLHQKQAPS